jgi:phospholipid/cholesterol/gamma-HCH transport system permease protein
MASLVENSVEDGRQVLRLSGSLTLARSRVITRELEALKADKLRVDLSDVDRMDTVGAWLIHKLQRDRDVELVGATDEQRSLIDNVAAADRPPSCARTGRRPSCGSSSWSASPS